jgi:hypothetical protein
MNQIAAIYTSFLRPELVKKTLPSYTPYEIDVFMGDQSRHLTNIEDIYNINKFIYYNALPYDCGLSFARNYLVKQAKENGNRYCLITADSIKLTDYISYNAINSVLKFLDADENNGIVGLKLLNRLPWEYDMNLIDGSHFSLKTCVRPAIEFEGLTFCPCDIVKNFFLAKSWVLDRIKWDNTLKLFEHEDFFYRVKKSGYNVFYTDIVAGEYLDYKPPEYKLMRDRMYHEYRDLLRKKYGISGWIKKE